MYEIMYPFVDKDYHGGVHHKLDYVSDDHWKNKNRHEWSEEDIEKLMIENFGSDAFSPAQHWLVLAEYNPSEDSIIVEDNMSTAHWWNLGKIINMGPCAFDSKTFPMGATATIGDYVVFNGNGVKRTKFPIGNMLWLHDTDVFGIVKDPKEYMYGTHEFQNY